MEGKRVELREGQSVFLVLVLVLVGMGGKRVELRRGQSVLFSEAADAKSMHANHL